MHAKKASRQCLFKDNFFVASPIALRKSRLLSPNDDEVSRHPFASRFDKTAAPLISRAFLYVRTSFISSYAYYSYNSYGSCSKRSLYFAAPSECSSFRRSVICLLVGSFPALSVSERNLKATFTFPAKKELLKFLAVSSIEVGLF